MNAANLALMAAESHATHNAELQMSRGWPYEGVGHVALGGYLLGVDVSLDGISYWYVQSGPTGLHGVICNRDLAIEFIETHLPVIEHVYVHAPGEMQLIEGAL